MLLQFNAIGLYNRLAVYEGTSHVLEKATNQKAEMERAISVFFFASFTSGITAASQYC